jgi:hypothetical protein
MTVKTVFRTQVFHSLNLKLGANGMRRVVRILLVFGAVLLVVITLNGATQIGQDSDIGTDAAVIRLV